MELNTHDPEAQARMERFFSVCDKIAWAVLPLFFIWLIVFTLF